MQKDKNNNTFSRMDNPKLHTKKKTKATVDLRLKEKDVSTIQKPNNRRVATVRAASSKTCCHMNLHVFLDEKAGSWYLHQSSNLDHKFHVPSVEDSTTLKEMISPMNNWVRSMSYLTALYLPPLLPKPWQKVFIHQLEKGAFLAQTIANVGSQERKTMDKISGIKPS